MEYAQELADRYVSVWNETDPARRRAIIAGLWVPDGRHYAGARQARGHDELETRITGSHDKNVRDGGYQFRAVKNAQGLQDVVTFGWEMHSRGSEEVVARGIEILIVDDERRILVDYQFVTT